MKNKALKFLAAGTAVAMIFSFAACGDTQKQAEAVSYVGIDVNPSVTLVLDKNDKVLSVLADNEDAQVLLLETDLTGMNAKDAAKKIAQLSVELGYLNQDNHGVNISIEGKADKDELTGDIEAAFNAEADGLGLTFSTEGLFSVNRRFESLKAEYKGNAAIENLTLGEFRLILEAKSVDDTLTFEAAAELDLSELLALINQKAEEIEPYATAAYIAAKESATRTYEAAKGQLTDALWLTPYIKYTPEILLGQRVHYGAIYNLYTSSARTLDAGIAAAEAAAEAKSKTAVSDATLETIAAALGMSEEEKAAFIKQITDNGKTVAALDNYLDIYFKNMTKEERAAIAQKIAEITAAVQAEADKIDAAIAEEYKAAFNRLCLDIVNLIPESIRNTADTYFKEFNTLVDSLKAATDGKEPLPAAHAAQEALEANAARVLITMKNDLTKEEVQTVEEAIQKLNDKLAEAEKQWKDAIAKAEEEAKAYLESLKTARTEKTT